MNQGSIPCRTLIKSLVLSCMFLATMVQAQTSHRSLSIELLQELRAAVSDSLSISGNKFFVNFTGDTPVEKYFNESLEFLNNAHPGALEVLADTVEARLDTWTLSINSGADESIRNTTYTRQLDLNVLFRGNEKDYKWQGRISDQLSKVELKAILDEDIPLQITGDYIEGEPAISTILISTLGVFVLVATFYFIRT